MARICWCPELGRSWPGRCPYSHLGARPGAKPGYAAHTGQCPELTGPSPSFYTAIQPSRGIIRLFGWTLSTMGTGGASRYSHVHVMTRKHDLSPLIFWWRCTCYQLLSFGLINRFKEKDYLHDSQNVMKVSGDSSVRGLSYWYLIVCSKKGFCYSTQPRPRGSEALRTFCDCCLISDASHWPGCPGCPGHHIEHRDSALTELKILLTIYYRLIRKWLQRP